jgi:hypothetical protein
MLPLLALLAVTAVWGVTFVQVKEAIALYPLFAFLALRFAIASAALALPGYRRVGGLGRDGLIAGVFLGLLLAAGFGLQTPARGRSARARGVGRLRAHPGGDPRGRTRRCRGSAPPYAAAGPLRHLL